jgi:hypothetical protein
MYTLADLAARIPKDNTVQALIDVSSKVNGLASFLQWVPGNSADGKERIVSLTAGNPPAAYSRYNEGYLLSKVGGVSIKEKTAKLEVATTIEQKLAKDVRNPELFRFQNVMGLSRGLMDTIEQKLFYEQVAVNQDGFDGLHRRFTDPASAAATQVVNATGTAAGKQTSIWIIKTGEGGARIVYPDNETAGMQHTPFPPRAEHYTDGGGNQRIKYMLDDVVHGCVGLAIDDWRSVAHVINVDTDRVLLAPTNSSFINITELVIRAMESMDRSTATGPVGIFMPKSLRTAWRLQQRREVSAGGQLSYEVINGQRVLMFDNAMVYESDAILTNMNQITGF